MNMSISEETIEVNEDEVNDLMNSVTGGYLHPQLHIDRLPVISVEETVHDSILLEDSSATDAPPSTDMPDPHQVICENDIIGKHASITYEDSLIHLTNFLVLPVDQCPFHSRGTGEDCYVLPHFEVHISSRGTATIIEWTSNARF